MAWDEDTAKLFAYFSGLEDDRIEFENHWQEISEQSLGRRDFTTIRTPGQERLNIITDTTSLDSHRLLVAVLQAMLTNPDTDWADFRYARSELGEIEGAAAYLETIKERVMNRFSDPTSGFATNIAECYGDVTGFGNTGLFTEEHPTRGALFQVIPLPQLYFDETHRGVPESVFRKFKLKAWQAVDKFGAKNVPGIAKIAEKHPNRKSEFVHHVRRNKFPLPGRVDAAGMAWESIYLNLFEKTIVKQPGGYREMPYAILRWRVDSGETYGRGPGQDTLPNQRMLNAMWLTYIRSAEKAVDPPVLIDNSSVIPGQNIDVTPSAALIIQDDPGGPRGAISYLENRAQFTPADKLIEDRTQKIEHAWHADLIKMFQDPRMTATGVLELARLSQRVLAPLMGRVRPFLQTIIDRVFAIEARQADFPPPPPGLDGEEIKIVYVSPIARAQKASDAQAILDTFAAIAAMVEVDPDAMDNFNFDNAVRAIAENHGVPASTLNSRRMVDNLRAARAEAAEREAQQQQLLQGAEVASKLIPAVASAAPGSP